LIEANLRIEDDQKKRCICNDTCSDASQLSHSLNSCRCDKLVARQSVYRRTSLEKIKDRKLHLPTIPLHEWIELLGEFYKQFGYVAVFLGSLGENTALLGFLLPGNSLALLGAVYARLGILNLGWVIFLASLGTILGYHIDYLLGRFILARVASNWSRTRLGRRIRLAGRLRLARMLIAKHGGKAILISHLGGQFRSFVALSAGMTRMRYPRFLGYELLAATLWNTAFCLLGFFLASQIDLLQMLIERTGWVLFGVLVLLFLAWRLFRRRTRRRIRQKRHTSRHTITNAVPK
jgi:membrane protein DedA with SNARE-associated domain